MTKRINKYINAIGVELEGGWKRTRFNAERRSISGYTFKSDGSVQGLERDDNVVGEINSVPMTKISSLRGYIKYGYPNTTNQTCGLHVHISLNNDYYYSQLMSSRFYNHFIKEMKKYGKKLKDTNDNSSFLSRLAGKNNYCKRKFKKEEYIHQMSKGGGGADRYNIINYAYRQHGTIEFRVFPMFSTPVVSTKVVEHLVVMVTKYLKNQKPEGWSTVSF